MERVRDGSPSLSRERRAGDLFYKGAGVLFALSGLAVTVGAIWVKPIPAIAGGVILAAGFAAYQSLPRRPD